MNRQQLDIRIADHPGAPTPAQPAGTGAFQLATWLLVVADQANTDLVRAPRHRRLMLKICEAWVRDARTDPGERGRLIDEGHATVEQIAWPIPSPSALGVTAADRAGLLAGLTANGWLRIPPGASGTAIPAIGDVFADSTRT